MPMLFRSIASLLVMLVIGCNTVDPDECWVNTSGGVGGGGTFPTGAGVGATSSGDFFAPPPGQPLDYGGVPNPCMTGKIALFSPSDFPFVTIVQDDGTGKAGGWQAAKANLKFEDVVVPTGVRTWYCGLTIQMPLRTEVMGKISASRAANFSVEITDSVASSPDMDYKLPEGIFCTQFVKKVDVAFKSKYPSLGASAVIK